MKRNTIESVENGTKNQQIKPVDEGTLYLAVLMVSVGFFALLIFAASAGTTYDMDAAMAALPKNVKPVKTRFEKEVAKMVEGDPIEAMVPYIAMQDPETAKYLVSIAKHESNWGKYSPKDADGKTCYNYWGYRGGGDHVTESGYTCFESPKEAVAIVGSRLDYLVKGLALNTPEELIVWKCGRSCAGHARSDVARWIGNVDLYSRKIERVAGVEESR